MKKTLKRIVGIVGMPVALAVIVVTLLYIRPVQNWLAQRAARIVAEKTGMQIKVGRLALTFPLDLQLEKLEVIQHPDTFVNIDRALIDLDLRHIMQRHVEVETILLEGGRLNLSLDTDEDEEEEKDTASTTLPHWTVSIRNIELKDNHVTLALPHDSIKVEAGVNYAQLKHGRANLEKGEFSVGSLALDAWKIRYSAGNETPEADSTGNRHIDYNHLWFDKLQVDAGNLTYRMHDGSMHAEITNGVFKEKSGMQLDKLLAHLYMDGNHLLLKELWLQTPYSKINGKAQLRWKAFEPHSNERLTAVLRAHIGKNDVMYLAGAFMPKEMAKAYPDSMLRTVLKVEGNVDSMQISECELNFPRIINMKAYGTACNLTDSTTRSGDVFCDVETFDLRLLKPFIGVEGLHLPPMQLTARARMRGEDYSLDGLLREGGGSVGVNAKIGLGNMVYKAEVDIRDLQLHNFLPNDSIYELTAWAKAEGRGTDLLSKHTTLQLQTAVEHFRYNQWNLDSVYVAAHLKKGKGFVELNSQNDLLDINACVDAEMNRKLTNADFSMDLRKINLHALKLTKAPVSASMVLHLDGKSNLSDTHQLKGAIQAMQLIMPDTTYHPVDLELEALMNPDTIFADAKAGDLVLKVTSGQGVERLLESVKELGNELDRQMSQYELRQDTLRGLLPKLDFYLHTGKNNPLCNYMRTMGYRYEELHLDIETNPERGINGNGHINTLSTGGILLDTIQVNIFQDEKGVNMEGRVRNGPKNKTVVFESNMHMNITSTGAVASLNFHDANGKKSVDVGLKADNLPNGFQLHFTPLEQIIAYRTFSLNEGNFIRVTRDKRIEAKIDLITDDGTGLKLYSTPNEEALQDLSLSVNHFNLGELARVIPYMPEITGFLHGDVHYVQSDSSTHAISTDLGVKEMTYNGSVMGNVGANVVYLPNPDGTHIVDGILTHNDKEIVLLNGMYFGEEEEGTINASAQVQRLPLSLANAFIPNGMAEMKGYIVGEMEMNGPMANPLFSGLVATDSMYLESTPYNIHLRFPDDTIRVEESVIDLNRIEAYSQSKNPLTLDGKIDCSDLENIALQMNVRANNYKLIDAPKSKSAVAYGKAFVNLNGFIRGTLDNLTMRGRLSVLGNTDVTYVLKDSPLTVEDQLADLVTFMDFSDTTNVEKKAAKQEFIDMQIALSIEQAAQVHCLLSENGADYINLEGGGDLNLTYDTQNGMKLNGRYTIIEGEMNYTVLPVVGSKHFSIINGSYVEFNGNMTNPLLNISATERVKTSVNEKNVPRTVAFDVGLHISQTLENMGLEFTLDAPEDITTKNQLASMSNEEKGRVAVTMLATGMYISDLTSSGGFSTTNTLNSYLQNEINQLVGMAQSTIDVNIGIENSTTETGSKATDYSFSFAKRFWGNRITLIVGGKVRSGADVQNTGQSIIDNVSLEYRLDQNATRYVKLYYDRNYESILEGELTEMGAGVVFRRKTDKLGELFIFRKKNEMPRRRNDGPTHGKETRNIQRQDSVAIQK